MRDLRGKVAVITGAAGGIGRALVARLAAEGCALALVDRDEAGLRAVAPPGASVHVLDLRAPGAVASLVEAVLAAHGRVDLVVNNAGVTVHGPFERLGADDVDFVLDVNLRVVAQSCRAFLPHLKASRGHLVNVASMAALHGVPMQSVYAATKAGVRSLSQTLRVELAPRGVGVTAVLPGTIATGLLGAARSYDPGQSAKLGALMLRFGASPDRVAHKVVRAVRADRGEVFVGWDTVVLRTALWLAPSLIRASLSLSWRRFARLEAPR